MLNYVRNYKRKRAIKSYICKLGPSLVKRYGASDQYTVLQVQKTAMQLGLNLRYIRYAIAMFRAEESVNSVAIYRIHQSKLNKIRSEIGAAYFDGNPDYSAKDILRLGKPFGWKGGASPSWQANRLGKTSL